MLKQLLFATAALCLPSIGAAQQPSPSAAMFGVRESVHDIDISPDGSKVVYVAPGPGKMSLVFVADLAGGRPKPIMKSTGDPETLSWCAFLSNTRLVCRVHGITDYEGLLIGFSRLSSIDVDGGKIVELGQRRSFHDGRLRQFDGEILDWLPDDGTAVLMARDYVPEIGKSDTRLVRRADGLGVDRIDVKTLKSTVVEHANRAASEFISDGRGNVRIMESVDVLGATGLMGSTRQFSYRRAGSREWQRLGSYDSLTRQGMIPVAVDATLDAAYALQKLNGRFALYRVKLDGSMATELVYANDKVDVDNVVRIGRGARVIGVTFAEEARQVVYFDEEYAKLAKALSRAIPKLPLIRFAGSSADNNKLLIFAGSDADPGRYYTYDKKSRNLNEIMLVRPELETATLATMKPVSYPAADGTMVPAYLSVPPGREARNLPAIVMPHGGPSARDEWGFDWLTQYLVGQGYAVLQPNYRGSAGYGDAWLNENGFRGWKTSIGDVTAGAKWLSAQGIADPSRLAIVGWSYGGYAALQSAVTEPNLYKAVVAIAPVTDLNLLKGDARGFTNERLVAQFIGSGPHIREGSPLQNVERISAPVLMFHGDRDANVALVHSQQMDKALDAAGKRSELTVLRGLEHSLVESRARVDMLDRIGRFLATELGSGAAPSRVAATGSSGGQRE